MCTHEPMSSPFPIPNTLARVAPPTAHRNLPEIINHLSVPVDTSDARIPEVLRPVLDRALHPDPAQRYRNGNELAEAMTNDPQVKATSAPATTRSATDSTCPPATRSTRLAPVIRSGKQVIAASPASWAGCCRSTEPRERLRAVDGCVPEHSFWHAPVNHLGVL